MILDNVPALIDTYAYWIIGILFMLGIMGLFPLPEEMSMIVIGIKIYKGNLPYGWTLLFVFLGTILGMAASYFVSRIFGEAVIGSKSLFM